MTTARQWYRGAELPSLSIWWTDSDGTLIDFSGADGFELRIGQAGCPPELVKTTGITGAVGSGTETSGTPNVAVAWSDGDLDIPAGTYQATLIATFGTQDRIMATTIRILDVVADTSS